MRVVAIPFLDEDPALVAHNLAIAASHPSVDRVWGIASSSPGASRPDIESKKIEIVPQTRIGELRPGKGDAMNTAIVLALEEGVEHLHFYDADITNFDHTWIDGAEAGVDAGYEIVRHQFPRAATDAMVTWMITKPFLAMKYPGTVLAGIGQPLGGELLLTSAAIESMATSPMVRLRSDWGIDTALTFTGVASGHSLYEHYVAGGKRHSLYGSLADLRTMVAECFDVAARLPVIEIPEVGHFAEPARDVPSDLRSQSGYSVEATLPLLTAPWGPGELEYASRILPDDILHPYMQMVETGDYRFFDETTWHVVLTETVIPGIPDPALDALIFRLWVGRVLNYTTKHAVRGYEHALDYLQGTIDQYEAAAKSTEGDQR
ncbi:MAG TPA: hypothetical protein VIW94_04870 [Acidimicrobiia bacterium]